MNFNVWNIKEMLSMPSGSGAIKSSSWNNNQTDYSSLSDSQFLFGSQFCPENSETLSAPLDTGTHLRHPKQSQQNSLDSEPSIFTKYQTKPQLFGGGTKDGGLFPLPLSGGKSKGFLEQFEEKKKMAKDKCDSETLCSFISYVTESIHRLQTSVEKSEEHLSSRNQSILDSLETVAKTLQETTRAQSNLVLEAMQDKGSMEQTILEMQKRLEASQVEFAEMKSSLKHLEVLVMQQSKNSQQLCEQLGQLNIPSILADLKTFLSMPQLQEHVKDSASQTSPALAQSLNFSRQEKSTSGDPIMWQAQPLPAAWNPTVASLWPREDGVQSKGAKSEILQEEAALTAAQLRTRNKQDKEVQASCEHCALTKTEAKSHGLSLPGHKVPGNKDLVSQRASPPGSLDANNFATSIENSCQEYLAKDMFSCDPCGRGLVTDPKDSIVESGKKGKKQRPRKGRLLARKVKPTSSKTCAVRSKVQGLPPPVSDPQRPSPGQREPQQQPLCLRQSRSCPKPAGPTQGGAVMPSKTGTAVQRVPSRFSRLPPRDRSRLSPRSLGDHRMSWFSSLDIRGSQSTLYKEQGKNLLYDLAFDSSDDSF